MYGWDQADQDCGIREFADEQWDYRDERRKTKRRAEESTVQQVDGGVETN